MYLNTTTGLPWLDSPVMLHSSRMDMCMLTAEQCAYRSGHWRYWYQADHVYGLNTIYFLCAVSGVFALAHVWNRAMWSTNQAARPSRNPIVAGLRYLSYRSFHVRAFSWYSPVLGVILLGLVGFVYFMAMTLGPQPYYWPNTKTVSYGGSPPIATRSGFMALGLFPFVVLLSAKANWVTLVTGISHEKLQVFHRWTSWAMFVLALVHTFPFIIVHIGKGDMVLQWKTSVVYWTGVAALIPQAYLNIMSIGPIRNYCYEFFKATHYIAVLLFGFFFWVHCDFRLSSWDYFIAAAVLYFLSFVFSTGRSIFYTGIHHAHLELTNAKSEDGLVRVTVLTAMRWKPGQHIFVRFLTAGVHAATIHPFSICSLPEKLGKPSDMVFYIKPKSGFTARLARMAAGGSANAIPVLFDGPYGGSPTASLTGYEHVLLIAGGSGAGFLLPLLEDLIRCTCHVDESIRMKVHLVLAVRKAGEADWFKGAVEDLVHGDVCTCNIHISIYITGDATTSLPTNDKGTGETKSALPVEQTQNEYSKPAGKTITNSEEEICGCDEKPSPAVPQNKESAPSSLGSPNNDSVETSSIITSYSSSGRPNLPEIISTSVGSHKSVAIVACGPKSMLFDVRNSAAAAQFREGKGKDVYLHTESFSW